MPSNATSSSPASEALREAEQAPYEPLLPIEIKLICASLVLGVVLIVLLVWVSYAFF